MRLAVDIGPELWRKPGGVRRSIERAQLAEELGFDTIWASEDPDGWDAFSALAVLARSTERIHLGTGVTNPYYRHPNLISASVATLDHASDGRAFLGLGRGEPDWYRTAFGMEIGSPLRRVRETVDLLRQWWSPEQRATGEGEITVRGWKREFSPVGRPADLHRRDRPEDAGAGGRDRRRNSLQPARLAAVPEAGDRDVPGGRAVG